MGISAFTGLTMSITAVVQPVKSSLHHDVDLQSYLLAQKVQHCIIHNGIPLTDKNTRYHGLQVEGIVGSTQVSPQGVPSLTIDFTDEKNGMRLHLKDIFVDGIIDVSITSDSRGNNPVLQKVRPEIFSVLLKNFLLQCPGLSTSESNKSV